MRRLSAFPAAILAALAPAEAGSPPRRAAQATLPPDIAYRDPRPRFRIERPATHIVRAYVPRQTSQPIYNAPPQPLR